MKGDGKSRVTSRAQWVRRRYENVADGVETGIQMLEHRYTPLGRFRPGPFEGWEFLWQPAVVGFLAMCLLFAGGSFPNSPLKFDYAGTWFFGEPARAISTSPTQFTLLLSVVLGYGGLVLLMRVWLRLVEVLKLHAGALEVEACRRLAIGLVDGVADLLEVDFRDDVKARHGQSLGLRSGTVTGPRTRLVDGSVPERPMGSGCKPAGFAYGGSNPSRPTTVNSARLN